MPELLRSDLIGRYTDPDIGSRCFPCLTPCEKSGVRTRVITGSVTIGSGFIKSQTFDDLKMITQIR